MKRVSWLAASAAVLALVGMFLSGCKPRATAPAPEPKAAEQKSTAKTVIEGFTGKTAVDQGLSAKKQLQAIDQQRKKDIEALNQ